MTFSRYHFTSIVLCFCVVLLAGCSRTVSTQPSSIQEQAVNTTLTGTITKTNGKFFITSPGKPSTELDSYTIRLDESEGKKVSVTGQYSGTTLFVDKVE